MSKYQLGDKVLTLGTSSGGMTSEMRSYYKNKVVGTIHTIYNNDYHVSFNTGNIYSYCDKDLEMYFDNSDMSYLVNVRNY